MALLFVDGFDHYATADITKKYNVSNGPVAINATSGRRGGGGLRMSSSNAVWVSKNVTAAATFIVGFSFKYAGPLGGSGSVRLIQLFDSGTAQCDLRLNPDGTLSVTRNGTALTNGTSTFALSANIENYIEFKVTIADSISAGSCVVRVNGSPVITVATGQDTKNTANASANQITIGVASTTTSIGTTDWDDLYICDGSGSTNNDFLGDVRIDTLFPNGDGNYSQFTPSTGTTHYTLVDETAPNTTDYNDGANIGDRDSYTLQDLAALTSQTVYGVQVNAAVMKDDAGAKSASTFVRSGGVNGDGASAALSTSQVYVSQVYETNPNGSVAWTESTVNAMEAGVRVTA